MGYMSLRRKISLFGLSVFLVISLLYYEWVISFLMLLGTIELLCMILFSKATKENGVAK